ncbi:hypothetical protein GOBAR_AA34715 [Gossypium barbadense]|uniref:Uncharacterized protein n=1 Tax=Gossypium barbadense TaxID=3634 RepID=A0A2P5W4D5_GOSBA|nr:hypothetical protein GOBAR_AA34715 [Gossypium barbadense]
MEAKLLKQMSFKDRRNQQLKSYLNCRREQCHSTSDAKPCKVGSRHCTQVCFPGLQVGTVRICHCVVQWCYSMQGNVKEVVGMERTMEVGRC